MRGVVTEVLGSRHYIVKVAGNLWKRHIDQLLRRPADVASTHGFLASDYQQSMPLDVSPDMDQPSDTVPDSTIPSTYIPSTATLDESILASTGDSRVLNKQPTLVMPVTDPPVISQPAPLPEISDSANVDDTLVVQPDSLCEYPADTEKRYPTRTTCRPPRHLKDYELVMAVTDSKPFGFFIMDFAFYFFKKGKCYIVTLFCYCCYIVRSYVIVVFCVFGCACAVVRTRNKRRLECSCSMLVLFHNFELGFPSYNKSWSLCDFGFDCKLWSIQNYPHWRYFQSPHRQSFCHGK